LAISLRGVRLEFLFNGEETGFYEWIDAKEIIVTVAKQYESRKITVPVNRTSQRRTVCTSIDANGSAVKQFIIFD
jgi:hypothetical protein